VSTAAIVLAAGLSSRMAPRNKLLIRGSSGLPMVTRTAAAALASRACEVVIVTGHQAEQVEAAVRELDFGARSLRFVHAADYARGLSASLKAGIAALPATVSSALVCLGDMPLVTPTMLDALIAAHDPAAQRAIVVPSCERVRGNPVLWDRRFFAEMMALAGDVGARSLLARHAGQVAEIEIADRAVLQDFDTEDAAKAPF
jgi:molybdenum cofactor cytidylyltransferase